VYVGTRGGDFWILEAGKKLNVLDSIKFGDQIHSTPVASNGVLYISTLTRLYAIRK
jgi:hypothetical protein